MNTRVVFVGVVLLVLAVGIVYTIWFPSQPSPEPLHDAAYNGDLKHVRSLVEAGCDVNAPSELGIDPTDLLAGVSSQAVGKSANGGPILQIAYNPRVTETDIFGRTIYDNSVRHWIRGSTPLQAALSGGHNDIAKYLLSVGAKVNVKNELGVTPLLEAIHTASPEVVSALVKAGADVNAADHDGGAPLHAAVRNNRPEIVELLLAAGADANAKDCSGKTPLDWCARFGHEQIAEMLRQRQSDPESDEERDE